MAVVERRTQEQRSSEMRRRLARAAFEQIRDRGFAQFRTAAVSRNAGVSQGAQLHHFPTKDDLAIAAIEYGYQLSEETTIANFARFDSASDPEPVAALIDDCATFYGTAFDVGLDIVKGSATNLELRRRIGELSRANRDFAERGWLARLVAHGWSVADAQDVLDMTTSLVRGFAVRRWIRRDSGQHERLLARWVEIVYASFPMERRSSRRATK
jgi:AcrR family transcriptional regulator